MKSKVVGVIYDNPDGTNRQDVIRHVSPGDEVKFVLGVYEGRTSVRVDTPYGTIGYIPQERADGIAMHVQMNNVVDSRVAIVHHNQYRGSLEVNIQIRILPVHMQK